MRNFVSLSAKSLMIVGAVMFSTSFVTDTAYAGGGKDHYKSKYHYHTVTNNFAVFNGAESDGNTPSVCNGQLGWWTQIPMPGGKTFCVMHFTEFFKGNVGTGSDQVCVKTKTYGWGKWEHTKVVGTTAGACKTKSYGGDKSWSPPD